MDKPNPGSDEAVETGCICPVFDNHRGKGYGGDGEKFGWLMVVGCPVHSPEPEAA